jgi:hypothetical protein
MKKRPILLSFLAFSLLVMAASLPLQVMVIHHQAPWDVLNIISLLAPLNWAMMLIAPTAAYLLLRASKASLAAMFILACLVIYNNWLAGEVGDDYSRREVWLGNLLFVIAFSPLFTRRILQPILNPGMRWWMTPPRWKVQIPIRLKFLSRDGFELKTSTFDASAAGAFIPVGYLTTHGSVKVGTQCFVALPLPGVDHYQCRAEIVRMTKANGNYPSGLGIRFLGMTWAERKKWEEFLRSKNVQDQKNEFSSLSAAA